MQPPQPRHVALSVLMLGLVVSAAPSPAQSGRNPARRGAQAAPNASSVLLGRPTDRSIVVSLLSPIAGRALIEFGQSANVLTQTVRGSVEANVPAEFVLDGLSPNTRYFYRATVDDTRFTQSPASFMTQRTPGSTFTFALQGDSHPERVGRMFDAALYQRTLQRVSREQPDFYLTLGDDFSIEGLISQRRLTPASVDAVYAEQRRFLSIIGQSAPLFLVNGNHEEAARFLLDGTATSAPVLAGRARMRFFPLPAPDAFYSGNGEPVEHVGLPRDYYAWTWGDALFVTIDPYWHSEVQVDAEPGGGGGRGGAGLRGNGGSNTRTGGRGNAMQASGVARDLWNITLGDTQYAWLRTTLEASRAKYKFVFVHHVLGTGRGAVELADLFEWGGKDRRGTDLFRVKRPTWAMPIHQLFVTTGVSIVFQGHDHLFAKQEKDGVIYQETPNPADPTYQAFNRDAYLSGDILPNSGHLRVTVSPTEARVEYIRSFLPTDETAGRQDGAVAFSYTVKPRGGK